MNFNPRLTDKQFYRMRQSLFRPLYNSVEILDTGISGAVWKIVNSNVREKLPDLGRNPLSSKIYMECI